MTISHSASGGKQLWDLTAYGFCLIPLKTRSKLPAIHWKDYQDRRPTNEEVEAWQRDYPDCNIGVVTGSLSGIVVLDIDSQTALNEVQQLGLPSTPIARTARGWHYFFRHPGEGVVIGNFAGKIPNVDLRADGGYIVAPGSMHESGIVYHWEISPDEMAIAEPPKWLCKLIDPKSNEISQTPSLAVVTPTNRYGESALEGELAKVRSAAQGSRNDTVNQAAFALGQLVAVGVLMQSQVEHQLLEAAVTIGLSRHETQKTIASGLQAGLKNPRILGEGKHSLGCFSEKASGPHSPLPLARPVPPNEPFPVDSLGELLGAAAKTLNTVVQARLELCCQSILAATALACQPLANVHIDGREHPISCFFITIADSGSRKSGVDKIALWPIAEWQKVLLSDYRRTKRQYDLDYAVWKQKRDAFVKDSASSNANSQLHNALPEQPQMPLKPILTAEEATIEGLQKLLENGWPSVGLFSDEGGAFLGGYSMKEKRTHTISTLNSLWDGTPTCRPRSKDDDPSVLYGKRLCIHLMLQPILLNGFLVNDFTGGQGLLARTLSLVSPVPDTRRYVEEDVYQQPALRAYFQRMSMLLDQPLAVKPHPAPRNELHPRLVKLTSEAKGLWITFHDDNDRSISKGGEFTDIRAFGSKAPEHVLRLAAVLAIFDDPHATIILPTYIERAIKIVRFYCREHQRLLHHSRMEKDISQATNLLEWLRERNRPFYWIGEIYQSGPKEFRRATTARAAMRLLANHGHVEQVPDVTEIDGVKRNEVWRLINPC